MPLVRFSRLVSDASDAVSILPLLARAAVADLHADGAAVLEVEGEDLKLVAAQNLAPQLVGFRVPAETLGEEAGARLCAACPSFRHAITLPLVCGGDLFGALVLLFKQPPSLSAEQLELAQGLVDLCGIALRKANQFAELNRSYAELRASRQALLHSEKLRALGQMAAGISHDLRNILAPVLMQVQFVRKGYATQEELDPTLERMERVLRRGVDTVDRLRSFSRQSPDAKRALASLNLLVREAIDLCTPRLRGHSDIQLVEELGEPPSVLLEGSELVNAVLNLLVNAADAMRGRGGTITVRTGAGDGGGWVEVADTGPGIPEEVVSHLYEPFFTTKGEEGTGLGLSMVYAFAQRNGGQISLDTAPEQGAAFRLWFPAAPDGAIAPW